MTSSDTGSGKCVCFKKAFHGAADVFMQMLLSQVCVGLRGTDRLD